MNRSELINLIANHIKLNIEFIDDSCEIEKEIDLPEWVICYKFEADCYTIPEEETNFTHVYQFGHKLETTAYDLDGKEIEMPYAITNDEILTELKQLI